MKRHIISTAVAIIVLASASAAQAQEIFLEGPLAGAPACRNCALYRQGRFSIAPMFSFTLLDDYRRHIFIGARAQYNITDWLAVGVTGAAGGFWGDLLDTNLTEQVATRAPNGIDSNRANFPFAADEAGARSAVANTTELLGRIQGYVSVELTFIPFRGKFGLFSRLFLDVDMYIFLGYPVTFVDERADVDCRSWSDVNDLEGSRSSEGYNEASWNEHREDVCPWVGEDEDIERAGTRVAVSAGTYGLGVSIYANNWLSISLEYRVMPILWNHTGTDERGMGLQNVDGEIVPTLCPSEAADGEEDYCGDTGEFPDHRINESDRTWTANHQFALGVAFHFPFTPRRSE